MVRKSAGASGNDGHLRAIIFARNARARAGKILAVNNMSANGRIKMRVGAAHVLISTIVKRRKIPSPPVMRGHLLIFMPVFGDTSLRPSALFIAYSVLVRDLPGTSITELAYGNFN